MPALFAWKDDNSGWNGFWRTDGGRYRRGGKHPYQMAFGDTQPLTEFFHAVKAGIVCPDVLHGLLHQRGQGGGGAVGPGKLTEQGKGQLAAGPAVGRVVCLGGKLAHQLGSGRAGLAPGEERQLRQPGQKLQRRLPGEL